MKHTHINIEEGKAVAAVPKIGVFAGLSNSKYHGGEGISKSGLDIISKSPAHYQHSRTSERKSPTAAQRIGTIAHALILEPETFWDIYAMPFEAPACALKTSDDIKARLAELGQKTTDAKAVLTERLRAADPAAVLLDDAREAHAAKVGNREILTAEELAQVEGIQ